MFDRLKKLFGAASPEGQPDGTAGGSANGALPMAVASILVEAAAADEHYTEKEKEIIAAVLARQFDLDAGAAADLRAAAESRQAAAADIHQFTKTLKEMAYEDKIALIEDMWRIIMSDGARDAFEDTLVRRVCGLIYVSDLDSGAARRRIEAEREAAGRAD